MPEFRRYISRLIAFFRAGKADADLAREINAHLQLLEDQFIAKGMTPKDARSAAKRAFGGVEQAKENQRETRTFAWLTGWSIDFKLGMRMTRKWPGLTVIAIASLAVGIGAGATYFEFISNIVRPKTSFPGSDRLVGILNWDPAKANFEDRSLYEFTIWKKQLTTVEDLGAGWQIAEDFASADGQSQTEHGWEISASAFRVLPVPPIYGRTLLDDDEKPGAEAVAVIGEDLWKTRFNSDPHVIGRRVRLGDTPRTVVGIMPHGFGFPVSSSFWTPLHLNPATIKRSEGPPIRVFGRLAPDVDLDQANAELKTIAGRMNEGGSRAAALQPSIHPYVKSFWIDFSRSAVNTLTLIVYSTNIFFIALLGICAANVAQLVFARTTTRESEISVRTALGASRRRIVGQLVAEALVLASVAAIIGLAGASLALPIVNEAFSTDLPFWWNEHLRIETIAYTALLVIIAALVIGGVPALKATNSQLNTRLKVAGAGGSMRFGKLWTGIIVTQVALTAVFLLALVSFGWITYEQSVRAAEVTFPKNEYLAGTVMLEEGAPVEREKAVRRDLLRRLNEDAEVINATFSVQLPVDVDEHKTWLELASTNGKSGEAVAVHDAVPIGSNYFETFQQPLVAGRLFTTAEIIERRHVVIVDETFVRQVLGGKGAVGQLVRRSQSAGNDTAEPWLEIVGVVKDITIAPNKKTTDAMFYRPAEPNGRWWQIVVHSRSKEATARLRSAASATDPQIRLASVLSIKQEGEKDAETARSIMMALGIVASVALMLAAAGIHSLISFTLASRRREIGIRTALGAAPIRIVTGLLSSAFVKVGIGIFMGSLLGVLLVSTTLNWALSVQTAVIAASCVAVFIIVVATISCIWPVRRALKIQPMEALRTT